MSHRKHGLSQEKAAAKAGLSVRSGRRIETGDRSRRDRHWRTRHDPLEGVWESQLKPMLAADPLLTPMSLWEYLEDRHPGEYGESVLRTLQRRVKHWRAESGPEQEVMFRQRKVPGRQGLSDFTHPRDAITVGGEPFAHLLYQFRLAFSGWRSVLVVQGGESYAALAEGLQRALAQLGGSPREHRSDSLSAARNNQQNIWTDNYQGLCEHYAMQPTVNNRGKSHENGAIESANNTFKRRLSQALRCRGSHDFGSVQDYQAFVDQVVRRMNSRGSKRLDEERPSLTELPPNRFTDYTEIVTRVTTSSTISIRRVTYTVPSRLIGHALRVHLHHDRLEGYIGSSRVVQLPRTYASKGQRGRSINYHHVIHSLVTKPRAFRFCQYRDELLPNAHYKTLWEAIDRQLPADEACKWIVGVLHLASQNDCEQALGEALIKALYEQKKLPSLKRIQGRFVPSQTPPEQTYQQHDLDSYDDLLVRANG